MDEATDAARVTRFVVFVTATFFVVFVVVFLIVVDFLVVLFFERVVDGAADGARAVVFFARLGAGGAGSASLADAATAAEAARVMRRVVVVVAGADTDASDWEGSMLSLRFLFEARVSAGIFAVSVWLCGCEAV